MYGQYGSFGRPVLLFEAWMRWQDKLRGQVARGELQEAETRADFPEFLFGPVRRNIWWAYQRVTPQWDRYLRVESAPDFRDRRITGINALRGIAKVGEYGHYEEMSRTERKPASLLIDTYGAVHGITRHAIVNDESGELLNSIPRDMGQAMGEFIAQAAITFIEGNPIAPDGVAMFHASRGNEVVTALSEDSLADGVSAVEDQIDDSGYRIRVNVALLAVKNMRMEMIARRILTSTMAGTSIQYTGATGVGSAVFDKGTINPVEGVLPPGGIVRDPYWSDANNWYLFANPDQIPGFAIAFLNGKREPMVGLKDPTVRLAMQAGMDPYTFEFDTIDYKVRHDFGIAAVDPRGVYRALVV